MPGTWETLLSLDAILNKGIRDASSRLTAGAHGRGHLAGLDGTVLARITRWYSFGISRGITEILPVHNTAPSKLECRVVHVDDDLGATLYLSFSIFFLSMLVYHFLSDNYPVATECIARYLNR